MKEKPSIIKRPLINRGNQWILGFDLVQLARIKRETQNNSGKINE
jgi:arsenate reductase-like glutaredoxin family protein